MSVTEELKTEMGNSFLEVRGRRPEDATVVLYRIQNQGHEDAFWPWAVDREGSYDTEKLKIGHDLKRCLLKQEPYEEHADGKHRIYTIDSNVDTILQIREKREKEATFSNLFSQFETVKEELKIVKSNIERPLFVAAMNLPATNLHETQVRTVTSLCRMIAAENAEDPAPKVYERLLRKSGEFREKHRKLRKALEEKANSLQEAVDFVEKCGKPTEKLE